MLSLAWGVRWAGARREGTGAWRLLGLVSLREVLVLIRLLELAVKESEELQNAHRLACRRQRARGEEHVFAVLHQSSAHRRGARGLLLRRAARMVAKQCGVGGANVAGAP